MKFIDLSTEDRVDILDRVSTELNIRQREVIEKDWWVTAALRASVIEHWKADYENMRLHMIYGESVSFEELINSLKDLNDRITELHII